MNLLPNIEEFIKEETGHKSVRAGIFYEPEVINLLREYGTQIRDKTLEWAAENSLIKGYNYNSTTDKITNIEPSNCYWESHPEDQPYPSISLEIDKQSILEGKTHIDLKI